MTTRSAAKLEASTSKVAATPTKKHGGRPRMAHDTEKENGKAGKGKAKQGRPKKTPNGKAKKVYCTCKGSDDGTPMVACHECDEWYHFRCINLSERDAEDLLVYICPSCQETTGRRTVMEWEGPDALEEVEQEEKPVVSLKKEVVVKAEPEVQEVSEKEVSESESNASSDDYMDEEKESKGKGGLKKRRTRRLSISSESESETEGGVRASRRPRASSKASGVSKKSASPNPNGRLKRKSSNAAQSPVSKRKKSDDSSSSEDPTRKYCLGKFEEMFCEIFVKYPHLPGSMQEGEGMAVEKKSDELTAEEKELVEGRAKQFAAELEYCVYDKFSEFDKQGKRVAGGKYKERFRMLTFNLSKPDRVTLHTHIAASRFTARDLSLMSSTDLANEDMKQFIKIAEQEALAHSILQKATARRAKISHKGLQEIEDVNGEAGDQRERERARELDDEEKRERERLARIKAAQAQTELHSGSLPPESPSTPQRSNWGAPPPVPQHAMHANMSDPSNMSFSPMRPPANPLFVPSASEMNAPVNELNLADLINIDEDPISPDMESAPTPFEVEQPLLTTETKVESESRPESSPIQPTGISPFAANVSRPDMTLRSSFDLNSLWSSVDQKTPEKSSSPAPPPADEQKDVPMEDFQWQEADDQDFDMFLEKEEESHNDGANSGAAPRSTVFEDLPQVYSGTLIMPLESMIPQETSVVARQMGGRTIAANSLLWQTLFPSTQLRIDGRVPVDKGSKFLLQMRMNATKELIAVAFSPATGSEDSFKRLMDYLISKNRHGLIFPWGMHPKEQFPGREFYIIPLSSTEPIPEYMELLDELRLPKSRTTNYLVGIWLLNKGKLAPPATPVTASTSTTTNNVVSPPQPPPSMSPPNFAHVAPMLSSLQPSLPPSVNPSAVAAEIASLTPEQIQLMLQTLSATAQVPQPPPSIQLAPALAAMASQSPPWPPAARGYLSGFSSNSPPGPHSPHASGSYSQAPYGRQPNDRDRDHRGPSRDRDSRGGRGRGRGRGRGAGRGRGRDSDHDRYQKAPDSGWPRQRGRS